MVKEVFDIAIDSTNDIAIVGNDFAIAESTLQHQDDLLIAQPGDFKESPIIGVGIANWINEEITEQDVKSKITREFENDGMIISSLKVAGLNNIKISASYED
jgi:hypothetical protein